jgi:hypothetical protein
MTRIWGLILPCLAGIFVLYACVSYPISPVPEPLERRPENVRIQDGGPAEELPFGRRLLRTEPEVKPKWVDSLSWSGEEPPPEELRFVGTSRFLSTAADARNEARESAFIQVMRFYGEFIQSSGAEKSSFTGSSAGTIAAWINREQEISNFAQAVVSQIRTDEYYTEIYLNGKNQEEYVVYTLCQIPRKKAEQDIADFAKNTSERYGNLLITPPSLHAALVMYGDTLAALERNPLHRAVAYYDAPGGRVNLYEYLSLQLNALAGSVVFAPLPSGTVEKTGVLDTTVTVVSSMIDSVGSVDCGVTIYGMNNPAPKAKYTVSADNSFSLRIFSSRLEPGRYTVQLELLLKEIDPRIRKNPSGSFNLEVTPLSAGVNIAVSGESIGKPEKDALVQGIQQGIEKYGVPVNLKTGEPEQGGAVFTVTLNFRRPDPVPFLNISLVICEGTISFSRNGRTQESASKQVSEFDAAGAAGQVRKFIEENEAFFRNTANKLSQ